MVAPVGIQLYTLRVEAERDFPAVLERLGGVGFVGVEPAGLHDLSPAEFRRYVEDAGMVVSSVHDELPIGADADKILDHAEEIGAPIVVVAFQPPDRFGNSDDILRAADELNEGLDNALERGIGLAYHNHWWEFGKLEDGRTAYDEFVELLDPDVALEIDAYWVQVAGQDPVELLDRLGPRARLLHVKDGPADGPRSPMVALGEGVVDVPRVASSGEWHIVELDRCATDVFEAVERSYRFLVDRGLSRGRV